MRFPMGFWRRITGRGAEPETKASSLDLLRHLLLGAETKSGASVTTATALEVATVLACVREIAEAPAALPFRLNRVDDDGRTRIQDTTHPVARLLRRPNGWQTSQQFIETLTGHAALCSAGRAIIVHGTDGAPIELLPLLPEWVTWKQESDWSIRYTVSWPDGTKAEVPQGDMFVLSGFGWDRVAGLPAVKYAREAIGLAMRLEEQQSRLFANGGRPAGALTTEQKLTEQQLKEIKASWDAAHSGSNMSGTAVLYSGLKYGQITLSNVDAQAIEQRKMQVEQICQAFGIYPQIIGFYGSQAPTYANAEQFFIQHAIRTVTHWCRRWEQAVERQLLTAKDVGDGYEARIYVQGMLRGDAKARGEYYRTLWSIGTITPNEIRGLEDMNPYDGGDEFRVPMNTEDPLNPKVDAAPTPAQPGDA